MTNEINYTGIEIVLLKKIENAENFLDGDEIRSRSWYNLAKIYYDTNQAQLSKLLPRLNILENKLGLEETQ